MTARMNLGRFKPFITAPLVALGVIPWGQASQTARSGAEIYHNQCASCHGAHGEGVADKHEEPLHGDRTIQSLTGLIERTMPEDEPKSCVGEDAAAVAAFIYDAFYSAEARARLAPAAIDLSRLTVRQYENVVADLLARDSHSTPPGGDRGLRGEYYNERRFDRGKRKLERADPRVEFEFGESSPAANGIGAEEFSIRWEGSVLAEETGDYEFVLRTRNGARLFLNDADEPLIDAWVSSGNDPRDYTESICLLGGRAYPLRLEFFKYKEKNAGVALLWKRPHGVLEVIPERNLAPVESSGWMVVSTPFPPDDSSVGYERGTSVSKAWDEAATAAAIEVADYVVGRLNRLAGTRTDAEDRERKARQFCLRFVERAFRRPLTEMQRRFFVEAQLDGQQSIEDGVKRVVLLTLKSPRFLYPDLELGSVDSYRVASRLSFGLWDSLPDDKLLAAAAEGRLRTSDEIRAQAERMIADGRTRSKVRYFLHHWLQMNHVENLEKDADLFPDFDPAVVSDLRVSLDLFLDDVVWGADSDFRQLLLSDSLFVNDRLAKFYGVEGGGGEEFVKVSFDPAQRSGVVTHPYLLAAFSYPQSSSPIHRGVFLTRNIVGRALKPPPMAVEFKESEFKPEMTMREKVAELTRADSCQTCHSVINPLGFSLEHFDAVGRFRTVERDRPIDAASDYTTRTGERVRLTGARDVAKFAAGSKEAQIAFIHQLFHQIVKQPVEAFGPGKIDRLHQLFVDSSFNVRKLLVEIAVVFAGHGLENATSTPTSTP